MGRDDASLRLCNLQTSFRVAPIFENAHGETLPTGEGTTPQSRRIDGVASGSSSCQTLVRKMLFAPTNRAAPLTAAGGVRVGAFRRRRPHRGA